ncbi:MAG: sigma-70 family RNA polymerase sigma factor, partial [Nocardioidaceae bacterium]|nr:sigma-70 family RNA polymerase sigma factor [Nocardioidaceae bacterium]
MRDEDEFVTFAQASRAQLRRTAYLMCGDWDRASDHVQEALIRVYVAWPRLERAGREYAYARKAVVSAVLDYARRKSSAEVVAEPDANRPAAGDLAETVTARAALMDALAALPPRQRASVVLRDYEDLSVGDNAAGLGSTEGTVKSQ